MHICCIYVRFSKYFSAFDGADVYSIGHDVIPLGISYIVSSLKQAGTYRRDAVLYAENRKLVD